MRKDLDKFKSKEEDLKNKERELKLKEEKLKNENERLIKREEEQSLFNKELRSKNWFQNNNLNGIILFECKTSTRFNI